MPRKRKTNMTRKRTMAYVIPEKFKLAIRPVPSPLWYRNLRHELGKYRWGKFRAAIIAQRGLNCEVCGKAIAESKSVKAHEEWTYRISGERGTAKLEKIVLCCWHCHHSEHFLLTLKLVDQGVLTERAIKDTITHFCRLNGVTEKQFDEHLSQAEAEWRDLSLKKWKVDWGAYRSLIQDRKAGRRFEIPALIIAEPARIYEQTLAESNNAVPSAG